MTNLFKKLWKEGGSVSKSKKKAVDLKEGDVIVSGMKRDIIQAVAVDKEKVFVRGKNYSYEFNHQNEVEVMDIKKGTEETEETVANFRDEWKSNIATKDFGVANAGPVPNTLLARQDLEGDSSTEKAVEDRIDVQCKICGSIVVVDTSNWHAAMRHLERHHKDVSIINYEDYFIEKSQVIKTTYNFRQKVKTMLRRS